MSQPRQRPAGPPGGGGGPARGLGVGLEKPRDAKGTLRKLLKLASGYTWGFIAVAVLAVLAVLFQTLGPYVLGLSTNEVAAGLSRMAGGTGGIDFDLLGRILLILAGVYVLSALFSYVQSLILGTITQRMMYKLRGQIDNKIRRLPLRYFDTNTLGDILSRVTNDVDTVTNTLQQNLPQIFSSILTMIMVFAGMLLLSPLLTLVGMITLPLTFLFSIQVVKRSQGFFRGQQKGLGDMGGHIEEMFTGHAVIKAYGREEATIAEFNRINKDLYEYSWKAQFISGLMMPVNMFFGNLGYLLVAVLGGIGLLQGRMQVGTIQNMIQYLRQFSQPITQISTMANMLQSTIAAAERIFGFLEEEEEIPDTADSKTIPVPKGNVSLSHVKFGYSQDKPLIRDLSIDLKSGDKLAIVGPTGAGKTTLVNLLLRFYDIQGGRITIDGVDIMDMKRADLRALFGMVLQDTWLFSGSIADNIRYGKLDASDEEVRRAAKAAYADPFIRSLPDGYNMVLGEDATNISQGQRQLLTIARAILSDPVILILDEATSSVDTRTEVLIQKAMVRLMENRTSFVIAHRLSTIRDAEMILVMSNGDIVETGRHEELLERGGFYANLYNSQFVQAGEEAN